MTSSTVKTNAVTMFPIDKLPLGRGSGFLASRPTKTYIAYMANQGGLSERRRRRSGCLADALRLQLEACREDEGLAAIVVSDELGFCVAHSGGDGSHDELAARLPMLADPARRRFVAEDGGGLHPPLAGLAVTTFSIAGDKLHACAVKEPDAAAETSAGGAEVLARVASGFTRLLAQ
jgi:hypothetical protein